MFGEVERNTHPAINAESFCALQVDRAAKATLVVNLTKERDAPRERSETTYQNIIGGLLNVMLSKSPAGTQHSVFRNQAAIITALLAHHEGKSACLDFVAWSSYSLISRCF